MSCSVAAQQICFSTKLSSLASVSTSGELPDVSDALIVRRPYRLLRLFPLSRVDCKLWIFKHNDDWRVMLSPSDDTPDGIIGVDFARDVDADADKLFIAAWRRIREQWTHIKAPNDTEIRTRIEDAVNMAFQQYCKNGPASDT